VALLLWPDHQRRLSVGAVPKLRDEDVLFRERIARVLAELRRSSGWTRDEAAEAIGVPAATLGKWERGEHAPKGYDLGRLYRTYRTWGADWQWFLEPPEVIEINPIRAALNALEERGAIAADEREARVEARRRATAAKRAAARGTASRGTRARSARQSRDQ
jgi:transcriptional regulator with XRE-family HTH domain